MTHTNQMEQYNHIQQEVKRMRVIRLPIGNIAINDDIFFIFICFGRECTVTHHQCQMVSLLMIKIHSPNV